jgi:hypothetical protein
VKRLVVAVAFLIVVQFAAILLLSRTVSHREAQLSTELTTVRAELVTVKAELAEAQTDAETYARGLRLCEAAK